MEKAFDQILWKYIRASDYVEVRGDRNSITTALNTPPLLWLNPMVHYKQPRSIQVVIFARSPRELHYLLLRRVASHGGFWQSVTGSLEGHETHRQAAVREVLEETGIGSREEELIDLGVINTFEIAPQWREKYAPGVTRNEEVCFALEVCECDVPVDPIEHDAYAWESYDRAMEMLSWDSNKRGLAAARSLIEQSSSSRSQE